MATKKAMKKKTKGLRKAKKLEATRPLLTVKQKVIE